ncbi:MAG: LytTR family transcriptional regulator DNA-binding domain-containing protein [Firmicutes bacterium]|nr:LytTR family transcriptional regulator DNA-binding domain-containing protein [Bacillota bacterium]
MSGFLGPAAQEWVDAAVLREAYLAGRVDSLPGLRPEVLQAWERSRSAGVDPELKQVPVIFEGSALDDYRSEHEVYRASLPALEAVAALLIGTGYAVILADNQGLVLYAGGDPTMMAMAERVGSLPGATWREDLVGNNALGTSLVTGSPVQFAGCEHWCAGWNDWVCAAVPILDRRVGAPLGAVALVGRLDLANSRMLPTAAMLARSVEHQLEILHRAREIQLQLEALKLQRRFPGSAVVAISLKGAVVWSAGPVPPGLTEVLLRERFAWTRAGLRGEQEVLLGGAYPCLIIPVWSGREPCGHVVIVKTPGGGRGLTRCGTPPPVSRQTQPRGPVRPPRRQIVAVANGRKLVFRPEQVLAIRTIAGRIHVLTDFGEWPTIYKTVKEVAERLPPEHFFQVDRGTLVNLDRVREIRPMFNRTVTLVMDDRKRTEIPVSRRRTAALRRLLEF